MKKISHKRHKKHKRKIRSVVLPFVLFVPFVANLLPSALGYGLSNSPLKARGDVLNLRTLLRKYRLSGAMAPQKLQLICDTIEGEINHRYRI